jgi:hypothetical protein
MPPRQSDMIRGVIRIGKAAVVFLIGGLVVHMLAMLIDYFLMPEPLWLIGHKAYIGGIFSVSMLPMMTAYGLCLLAVYVFWKKAKTALQLVQQKEIQNERALLVFQGLQRITGLLAKNISAQNVKIIHWVETRKITGKQPPPEVEKASRKISEALHSLSEVAFVYPYADNPPCNIADIEKVLRQKLEGNTVPKQKGASTSLPVGPNQVLDIK